MWPEIHSARKEMWDLNDSPDQIRGEESLGDNKGKQVGSQSNSSSSAVVIEEGSEEEEEEEDEEGERTGGRKRSSSAIFGFSGPDRDDSRVTRQFFPVEDQETGTTPAGGSNFPRAHWVGVKFCQSDHLAAGAVVVAGAQPLRKSRRGPRSRSSQYRGVTFYRRTGRWESHIWFVPCFCSFFFLILTLVSGPAYARIDYSGGPISPPTCGPYYIYVTGLWTSNTIYRYCPKY